MTMRLPRTIQQRRDHAGADANETGDVMHAERIKCEGWPTLNTDGSWTFLDCCFSPAKYEVEGHFVCGTHRNSMAHRVMVQANPYPDPAPIRQVNIRPQPCRPRKVGIL